MQIQTVSFSLFLLCNPLTRPRQHHCVLQQHQGLHGAQRLGSRPQGRRPLRATTERRVLYSHVGWRLQVTSTLAFKADFRPWVCSTHPGRLCLVGARRSHGPSTDDVLESNIGRTTDHWQGKTDHWRREIRTTHSSNHPHLPVRKTTKTPKPKLAWARRGEVMERAGRRRHGLLR